MQYNLVTESSIKQLIQHLEAILILLCDKLKMDIEPGVLLETSEDVVKIDLLSESVETSKDAEPPTKKVKKAK